MAHSPATALGDVAGNRRGSTKVAPARALAGVEEVVGVERPEAVSGDDAGSAQGFASGARGQRGHGGETETAEGIEARQAITRHAGHLREEREIRGVDVRVSAEVSGPKRARQPAARRRAEDEGRVRAAERRG